MSKRIYLKSIDGVVIMMSKHLYGYNNRAETAQKNLIDSGMDVISIIDTNKKGSNIISPEKLKYLRNKADICVYICMQNAMQHEIVAEKLFYMGFRYIVFLPVSSKYNMQAYKMVELWNRIYEGDIDPSIAISRYEIFLKLCRQGGYLAYKTYYTRWWSCINDL